MEGVADLVVNARFHCLELYGNGFRNFVMRDAAVCCGTVADSREFTGQLLVEFGVVAAGGFAIFLRQGAEALELPGHLFVQFGGARLDFAGDKGGDLAPENIELIQNAAAIRVRLLPDGGKFAGEVFLEFGDVVLQAVRDGAVLLMQGLKFDGDLGLQFGQLALEVAAIFAQAGIERADDGFEDLLVEWMGRRSVSTWREGEHSLLLHFDKALLHTVEAEGERRDIARRGCARRLAAGGLSELHPDTESQAVAKCDGKASPHGRIAAVFHIT